jgi:hypothetical protein
MITRNVLANIIDIYERQAPENLSVNTVPKFLWPDTGLQRVKMRKQLALFD